MTDRDDDERSSGDDDPMLKSMRAVWLQMRDEDPPESGVAALLAAARAKAETMQPKEPWWQRAFAVLRRPPVLAFASLAILVGGAVVITKRRDAVEAPPPVVSANQEGTGAPPDHAAGGRQPRDREGYDEGEDQLGGEKLKVGDKWAGVDAGGVVESPPAQHAQPPSSDEGVTNRRTKPAETLSPPPPPPEPPHRPTVPPQAHVDPRPQTGMPGLANGNEKTELDGRFETTTGNVTAAPPTKEPLAIAQDDASPKADSENQHAKKSVTKGAAEPGDEVKDAAVRGQATRREVSIDQLVQQCESAAARGDCAAVRAMAGRIKKTDPGAYRDRLERNAKIARCLK